MDTLENIKLDRKYTKLKLEIKLDSELRLE